MPDSVTSACRARLQSGQRIGHGQPQVVVAVHAEDRLMAVGRMLDDVADQRAVLFRQSVAHRVGQVDGGGPGVDDGLGHAAQKVLVGARGVLGGKFHIRRIACGPFDGGHGHFQHGVGFFAQFVAHVQIRCGQEGVDARRFSPLDGLPAAIDVSGHGPAQARHANVAGLGGDGLHSLEISPAGHGKPRLHDVHAQDFQLTRHAQLFLKIHGRAGRLLSIPEGGIKEIDAIGHDDSPLAFTKRLLYCVTAAHTGRHAGEERRPPHGRNARPLRQPNRFAAIGRVGVRGCDGEG